MYTPSDHTTNFSQIQSDNYIALRNEFTSIFNSFRALVVTQFAALAFVGKEIFLATDFERSLGLNFIFILVIFLPTVIGHNWQAQAIYQVSYIFVSYELPMLSKLAKTSDANEVELRNALWVLSNRVKGIVPAPITAKRRNRYLAGSELIQFHWLQIILAIMITAFALLSSGSSWFAFQKVNDKWLEIFWCLNIIIMIACIIVCIRYLLIAQTIIIDATKHWINYFNDSEKYTREYLTQFDRDFLSKLEL